MGDGERVLRKGVQDPTRIVEEFEGLVTGVDDCRGDLQVLQSVDIGVGSRDLQGQAGGGRDGDCRSDKGDEGNTKGREEHRGEGSEGG